MHPFLNVLLIGLTVSISAVRADEYVKASLGTDASLGLAAGVEYQIEVPLQNLTLRAGPALFYSYWSEETEEFHTYTETSSTFIVGLSANVYQPTQDPELTLIYGGGVAFMSNSWQETSATDSSIGPLIDGVYTDSADNTGAGVFFNIGLNKAWSDQLALEVNIPVFMVPYAYGTALAPAVTVSVVWSL